MTTRNQQPPKLTGCDVLPPMDSSKARPADTQPKRKPGKRNAGNRFAVLNAFVDCTAGRLSRGEILVWLVLYRDTRNGIAQTSQADIARRAGTADRTVRRVIRQLERRGLLKTVYHGGLNRGASKYRVIPTEPAASLRT
jgi:hypothetical protein